MLNLTSQFPGLSRPAVLSGDLVLTEHAIATLRQHLVSVGLNEWRIFNGPMPYLPNIDSVLDRLDADALWESTERSLIGEEALVAVTFDESSASKAHAWQGGVLHLRKLQVVIARWYWNDPISTRTTAFYLMAAPQLECVEALREQLIALNRQSRRPVWRIAGQYGENPKVPREPVAEESLLLSESLRKRVEADVLGFFSPRVAAMYKRLAVPYRRGVLLYGEPGNGKTSLIRYVGAKLPDVAAILLRASATFDTDDLSEIFENWKQFAPALLVIEDLTAILERVNLSTFLNLLDGVDRKTGGGLMLIASTNHPQKLDPAISNRPGRFDVVIELPAPDALQRWKFLQSRLQELDVSAIERIVSETAQLSFAHLEEIVQLSGMLAIREGREVRQRADVDGALEQVRRAFDTARNGYSLPPEMPFGLAALHKARE